MKIIHAIVVLSSILVTSNVYASNGSMAGIKIAKSIKNNINDDPEFQSNNLEIPEVMSFGAFYSTNGDDGKGLGFESEFLMNQEADLLVSGIDIGSVSTYKLGMYVNYHLPITNNVFAKGKIGYERSMGSMDVAGTDYDEQLNEAGVSAAIGAGIDLTDRVGVLAEYKYTDSAEKMNLLSLGVYTKF